MKRTVITTLITAIATASLSLSASMASAQAAPRDPIATPGIDKTQARQQARINQGTAKGKLTPAEQANLQQGQANIANAKAAAIADGKVTQEERKQIKQMQKAESKKIRNKKHNQRQQ